MVLQGTAIDSIASNRPVRVFLPLSGAEDRHRANSIFQRSLNNEFKLLFKYGILPTLSLDLSKTCLVSIDLGASNITIEATIRAIISDHELLLGAKKLISHDQLREFFRVDAIASITCRPYTPQHNKNEQDQQNHLSIVGETVDISGSGLLAIFPKLPPDDKHAYLDIILPGSGERITSIVACKRREKKLDADKYEVAFEFVDISAVDRNKIIGCCLSIQRKLLRL